ncbi:MAG: preprotein translocase subunit SecA [Gemmatimonadetes bacterium]|nr:preprotein translocase subunit SecA [Gemmatimonadota bacterium]
MLKTAIKALLGSRHRREAKKLQPLIDEINEFAEEYASLADEQLRAKTDEFKQHVESATAELKVEIEELREQKRHSKDASDRELLSLQIGELEAELLETTEDTLAEILPEAFAVVKDACRRLLGQEIVVTGQKMTWDMVPYDVQLIGAIALHRGKVEEMATGEGKTLVATMPLYLNALAGRGAHLVTVNTYLAQRDAEWMGTVYEFLGLTVDVIDLHDPGSPERQAAYSADITYGTNNEFGFDYLRDNMVHQLEQRVQREYAYAIIDEVDSILIDEARTPLIISGPVGSDTSTPFKHYNSLVGSLYKKQLRVANEMVSEAEKHLADDEQFEAGEKLLAVKRGAPKHRRFMKLLADDPSLSTLVNKVEADYMREKRLHEIDEMLYFAMDEKGHNVHLSDRGLDELSPNDPEAFTVPDLSAEMGEVEKSETLSIEQKRERMQELEAEYAAKSQKIHVIHQLLKAYTLFHRDEKYIIGESGEVVIVDEFTGRQMAGRRWSDGLHQAVEAKEGVEIHGETQTLATITIQNYFRMYDKLAGMTGTAETEETEFHQIYKLDVLVIPTNQPVVRDDRNDLIFRTKREKYNAIMDEIERVHKLELPVLVGTTNVDVSETLSRMLKRRGVPHQVLNAKHHKSESEIVRDAGQPGAVTIATNMAGRGTDIKLGKGVTEARTLGWLKERGIELDDVWPSDPVRAEKLQVNDDDDVLEAGGLQIIGSERHDSRRIDRQLRGRSGRQGDPGASQFYLSLEDDLMRLFGSERIANVMDRWGAEEGEVITHGLVTKSIERAQRKVEINNFEARKRLLDYDDVMNQQREVIYDMRLFALEGGEDLKGEIWDMIEHAAEDVIDEFAPADGNEESWDLAGLRRRLLLDFFVMVAQLPEVNDPEHEIERHEIEAWVIEGLRDAFHRKLDSLGEHQEQMTNFIMLSVIDEKWKDHLYDLDHLKASIGFRGWGQKDPLVEYKKEAYDMFVDLMTDLRKTVGSFFFRAQFGPPQPRRRVPQRLAYSGPSEGAAGGGLGEQAAQAGQRQAVAVGGGRDELGMSARASGVATGVARAAGGPDPRQLSTNRGERPERKPVSVQKEPGRNDPCPCGSGKKYKKCHGR